MTGGKREGAGRKPTAPHLKKVPISLALPQWILDWMAKQEKSRAVLIEDALCTVQKIKPPL
jgi:hypothetical protein